MGIPYLYVFVSAIDYVVRGRHPIHVHHVVGLVFRAGDSCGNYGLLDVLGNQPGSRHMRSSLGVHASAGSGSSSAVSVIGFL